MSVTGNVKPWRVYSSAGNEARNFGEKKAALGGLGIYLISGIKKPAFSGLLAYGIFNLIN